MKTIILISHDMVLISIIEKILEEHHGVVVFRNMQSALDYIYNSTPNLMIVDMDLDDRSAIAVLNNLKEDPIFNQLPILALLADDQSSSALWQNLLVEDFLKKSDIKRELILRVELAIVRSERVVEINPLTRLPGNIAINKQIQARLDSGQKFSLAYADLDHFKPFNDYYGFSRGDEVLRMAGRLITNTVKGKQPQDSFVGHIGGDDFVLLSNISHMKIVLPGVLAEFDSRRAQMYHREDLERGFLHTKNRQNRIQRFPLMTLSVAIISTETRRILHYGRLVEIASELKHYVKTLDHHGRSLLMWDRRSDSTGAPQ